MKTIRQIADEIGVSKTAVNKQIANLGLRSGLRKNGNQFAIDEHQEALINRLFLKNRKPKSKTNRKLNRKPKTTKFPIWFAFYRPPSTRCKGNLK